MLGPGRIFNAPLFHRVHHGADVECIDRNFGGVFLLFDRLFATFAPYRMDPRFGVAHEPSPQLPIAANVTPWTQLIARVQRKTTLAAKLRALFVNG
jgi:sterol desaturase/sphingolipid hydroxylase (fatty acid hydroxylase superfamily)